MIIVAEAVGMKPYTNVEDNIVIERTGKNSPSSALALTVQASC
jgi:hypothetical protein